MDVHIFEYAKNLKWVNYMVYMLYLNKAVFKMYCAEQCLGYPLCVGKWEGKYEHTYFLIFKKK